MEKEQFTFPITVSSSFSFKSEASQDAITEYIHRSVAEKTGVISAGVFDDIVAFKADPNFWNRRGTLASYNYGEITVHHSEDGTYQVVFRASLKHIFRRSFLPFILLVVCASLFDYFKWNRVDYGTLTVATFAVFIFGLIVYILLFISLELYLFNLKRELKNNL